MTPVKPGAPQGQQPLGPSVADFEAVIERHIADVKVKWDSDLVVLFDAERAAAAEVMDAHRRRLEAMAQRAARLQEELANVVIAQVFTWPDLRT